MSKCFIGGCEVFLFRMEYFVLYLYILYVKILEEVKIIVRKIFLEVRKCLEINSRKNE